MKLNKKENSKFENFFGKSGGSYIVLGPMRDKAILFEKFEKNIHEYLRWKHRLYNTCKSIALNCSGENVDEEYLKLENEYIKKLMNEIDIESDHDHKGMLNIKWHKMHRDHDSIYCTLSDFHNKWKSLKENTDAEFSINLGEDLIVISNVFTDLTELPPIVNARLWRTSEYICDNIETWLSGVLKNIANIKNQICKMEFNC